MPVRRPRLRFEGFARRGLLAALLLPGLLLLNLLCFCVHDAAAEVVRNPEALPCHARDGTPAADTSDAPQPQHHGAACPHCGEGNDLFASPRAVDLASPGASAIPVAPLVFGMIPLENAIASSGADHSPPRLVTRNRILRI